MAKNVWVYKDDGTLQCGLGEEIALKEMQKQLEDLGATVINAEKRDDCRMIISVCGAPTGRVNAYEISEKDWEKIKRGIVGPLGFRRWMCDEEVSAESAEPEETVVWPLAAPVPEVTSTRANPVLIRELIGRRCRVYEQGDLITQDYVPNRVNIELSNSKIADIWFG